MIPDPRSTVTLCGHPEAVNGHCAFEGDPAREIAPCGNRWQLCPFPKCQPPAQVPGDPGCPFCRGAGNCVECDPETAWK